jgi:hypothetical protein
MTQELQNAKNAHTNVRLALINPLATPVRVRITDSWFRINAFASLAYLMMGKVPYVSFVISPVLPAKINLDIALAAILILID